MRACYGADPATEGVGPCQAGTQVCDAGGQGWGDCAGAVTPQPETCGDGVDDDCDGQVDQGCVCTPNAVGPCYDGAASTQGVGACQAGTRACNALGTGFVGSCAGQVLPAPSEDCATPVDDDCNGVVNEGCACVPGATQPCYSGPMGTLGVGVCHGGTQTCKANGQWGACAGEVTPANEVCGGGDENCDGQVDEGCTCTPGATASCYDGPAGTAGVGLCHAGTKTCAASGLAWDACAGEVTPSFEVCTNGLDDNCDGHVDECWTPVASLPAPRNWHAGALGPDGRIYVMGGEGNLGAIQASTFAYTVATNTWASVAPMGTPREKLGAATGADGRVYAVGGMTDAATWVATVEAYTPATNTWSAVASMSVKRREHAVVAGADGTIYAIGGRNSAGALATVEAYTPATNTWAPRASMPAAHYKVTAALGADGRIYAMGDASSSTAVLAYDPAADTWSPVAGYVQARKDAQAARASDGRIYAIGGYTNVELSIAEAYDPATNTWHAVAPMIDRRTLFAAVAGPDGRVYAIGGWQDVLQGGLTQVEAYKP
jgi:N-acetylneuraminic acid mutarotase